MIHLTGGWHTQFVGSTPSYLDALSYHHFGLLACMPGIKRFKSIWGHFAQNWRPQGGLKLAAFYLIQKQMGRGESWRDCFRDATGERKQVHCDYTDENGIRQQKQLVANKAAAQTMLCDMVRDAERAKAGFQARFEAWHRIALVKQPTNWKL